MKAPTPITKFMGWSQPNLFMSRTSRQIANGSHLGKRWQGLRRWYLSAHPHCAKCCNAADEVHHIQPRSTHPELTYDIQNLLPLCRQCHLKEHNKNRGMDNE